MFGTLPDRARAATSPIAIAHFLGAASAAAAPPAAAPPAAAPPAAAPPPGYGQPPPGYGQPPPGYGQPPDGYYPPPAYGQPPPGYPAPQGGYYPPPGGYYLPSGSMPVLTLPYENDESIPPGFAVRSRANRPLVVAGAITFGVSYLFSALIASVLVSFDSRDGGAGAPLFIPVVGPFVAIGTLNAEGAGTFWLVVDGLTQVGGAAMFVAGLTMREKYLQRTAAQVSLEPEVIVGPGGMKLKWTF